ncbi:hypothetical protein KEM55_005006 [Ascosphaera atra]|nr:hypothetical protein KEM55_005006 [Ascosphaera atra]
MPPKKTDKGPQSSVSTRSRKGERQGEEEGEGGARQQQGSTADERHERSPEEQSRETAEEGHVDPHSNNEGDPQRVVDEQEGASPEKESGAEQRVQNDQCQERDEETHHKEDGDNQDMRQEDEHSSLLHKTEVEELLRDQHQQFVANLAHQQRELQEKHEAAIEELRHTYESQQQRPATEVANHAQPPERPTTSTNPEEVPMSEVLALLQSLRTEVASLKRQAPNEGEAPPTQRRRMEDTPTVSSAQTIPGLPAEVAEAVHAVVKQPSHPAYGLSPEDVAVLCLKRFIWRLQAPAAGSGSSDGSD